MATLVPTLYSVSAFDANNAQRFQFSWSGPQARYNRLTIKDNATDVIVFENVYESMKQVHVLPAGSLTNGTCYSACIEIVTQNATDPENIKYETMSGTEKSQSIVFWCHATPTFRFANVTNGGSITNSNYTLELQYIQSDYVDQPVSEREALSQYQVLLYDSTMKVIQNFGTKYLTEYDETIYETISALKNEITYYIRATGRTKNGMLVDTGLVQAEVEYTTPTLFSRVDLVNNRRAGNIAITSNLVSVTGVADPENPEYINNDLIDLRKGKVTFSEGFLFESNWIMGLTLCGMSPTMTEPILSWSDGEHEANVYYRQAIYDVNNNVDKGFFELLVDGANDLNGGTKWHTTILSNFFDPVESFNSARTLWIVKENNYYRLVAHVLPDREEALG